MTVTLDKTRDKMYAANKPCPCGAGVPRLTTGAEIYPHTCAPTIEKAWFWKCDTCLGYVGCHPGTLLPMGVPANAELRAARNDAHLALDPIWRAAGVRGSRTLVYAWLAHKLKLKRDDCHIGLFDLATCQKVVTICDKATWRAVKAWAANNNAWKK